MEQRSHPGWLLYLAAAILALSVFLSGSRAGMVICIGLIAVWSWMALAPPHRSSRYHRTRLSPARLGPILVPVLLVTGALIHFGLDPVATELHKAGEVPSQLSMRAATYGATLRMFTDRFFYGIGVGGFAYAFPYYQPDTLPGYYSHAHCDWLEYLSELGIVGSSLLVALVYTVLRPPAGTERSPYAAGFGLGLSGVALHAIFDFPLHIPAIALVTTVWTALLYAPPVQPCTRT